MVYFATRISCAASETGFIVFIAIARKKGGIPIKYIAYKHCIDPELPGTHEHEMVQFDRFRDIKPYMPFGDYLVRWKRTSNWLYKVGAGGFREQRKKGPWIRVCSPYIY